MVSHWKALFPTSYCCSVGTVFESGYFLGGTRGASGCVVGHLCVSVGVGWMYCVSKEREEEIVNGR
jgi:hypothetical protein